MYQKITHVQLILGVRKCTLDWTILNSSWDQHAQIQIFGLNCIRLHGFRANVLVLNVEYIVH